MPRSLALAFALLLAGLVVGAPVSSVRAADSPGLQGAVTDLAGVLPDDISAVEQSIADLVREHGIDLFVLFVDTTEGMPAETYGQAVVDANSLGTNDAFLLVAVMDRTDWMWVSDSVAGLSDEEYDGILVEALEPRLRAGDFAGGVIATAEAIGDAVASDAGSGAGGTGGSGGGLGSGLLGPLLVGGGIGLIGWWFMRRRQAAADAEERDRRTGQLAREANALLIATDERVRDATQELGYVEAEYGETEVGPLRQAIAEARKELGAAFGVRQRLDDAEPEPPETREAMLREIVERSKRAQAALDREAERIQQLRDLERDAPAILDALPGRISAAEARIPAAETALAGLARYADTTVAPVRGNLEEARKGLTGAREAAGRGTAALAAPGTDRRAAAREARTAEQGLIGATALLDGIEKLAATARQAEDSLADELTAATTDLGEARRALAGAPMSARNDQAVDAAEAALRDARTAAARSPLDPVDALRRATAAHRAADEVLAAARQDAEQRTRFAAALDASIATAEADIDRAADFVASRRGGIGRRPRTRLAEAERQLRQAVALRTTDPRAAMAAAATAQRLADEALAEAGNDFDQWNQGGPGWGGQRGGNDQMGAILGGILTGVLLGGRGGGGGGGGWGGSPWGSPGPTIGLPGGWGGGGGGRSRGGGWGGGGGGGGRSRGGRW